MITIVDEREPTKKQRKDLSQSGATFIYDGILRITDDRPSFNNDISETVCLGRVDPVSNDSYCSGDRGEFPASFSDCEPVDITITITKRGAK